MCYLTKSGHESGHENYLKKRVDIYTQWVYYNINRKPNTEGTKMTAYTFGLTRKQCGVIFSNIKNGNLDLADDFSKWMYEHVADYKKYADSIHQDVMDRMKLGLEAIFSGSLEEANKELNAAYNVWHNNFR